MSLVVRCSQCNQGFAAPDKLAGKSVKCPGCGEVISVPGGPPPTPPAPSPARLARQSPAISSPARPAPVAPTVAVPGIDLSCRACKYKFRAPEHFAGRRVACPKCTTANQVPAAGEIVDELDELIRASASAPAIHQPAAGSYGLANASGFNSLQPGASSGMSSHQIANLVLIVVGSLALLVIMVAVGVAISKYSGESLVGDSNQPTSGSPLSSNMITVGQDDEVGSLNEFYRKLHEKGRRRTQLIDETVALATTVRDEKSARDIQPKLEQLRVQLSELISQGKAFIIKYDYGNQLTPETPEQDTQSKKVSVEISRAGDASLLRMMEQQKRIRETVPLAAAILEDSWPKPANIENLSPEQWMARIRERQAASQSATTASTPATTQALSPQALEQQVQVTLDKFLSVIDQVTAKLQGITDGISGSAAVPEMERLSGQLTQIDREFVGAVRYTRGVDEALRKAVQQRRADIAGRVERYQQQLVRVAKVVPSHVLHSVERATPQFLTMPMFGQLQMQNMLAGQKERREEQLKRHEEAMQRLRNPQPIPRATFSQGRSAVPAPALPTRTQPKLASVKSHVIRTATGGQRSVVPGEPLEDNVEVHPGDELQREAGRGQWVVVQAIEVLDDGRIKVLHEDANHEQLETVTRHALRVPPSEPDRLKPADELRMWTDRDGRQVKARFGILADGVVRLRTDANRVKTLPEAKLSEDDQLAARRLMKEREEAKGASGKRNPR